MKEKKIKHQEALKILLNKHQDVYNVLINGGVDEKELTQETKEKLFKLGLRAWIK